jgi:hypothetical protein
MSGAFTPAQQPRDFRWPRGHGVEVVAVALDRRVTRVVVAAPLVQRVTRHSGHNHGNQGQDFNRHGAKYGLG